MSIKSRGFTIVEVLVIAPVVILFIGVFIGLLVNLTGESLLVREKNNAAYDVQASLDSIESDIRQATAFLTTTGSLTAPQGKEDYVSTTASNTAFSNVNVNGFDALIIEASTTNLNPSDPARSLIYTGTGTCDTNNPLYTYMTVYFVASDNDTAETTDNALYKRTIVPQTAACAKPWQRNSCNPVFKSAYPSTCKSSDEKLVSGIATFSVGYFIGSGTTEAGDSNARSATEVSVNLGVSKVAAGNSFTYSGSTRSNGINLLSVDNNGSGGPTIPPSNPPITWTRDGNGPNPYNTTFNWTKAGNALNYLFRYRFGSGSWYQQTVAQSDTPSFTVAGQHRKQAVEVEVDVVANNGTFRYGTTSATALPNWNDCTSAAGWINYGGAYADAGFTKTSAGVVGLRGLVKGGTPSSSSVACTLPVGFRPSQTLMFQVAALESGASGSGRVDIYPDGRVNITVGTSVATSANNWVSLSGITFLSAGAATSTNWTNGSYLNGWRNYSELGNTWGDLKYAKDTLGRVHVEGLATPGTTTNGTVITSSLSPTGIKPSHYMHLVSRSNIGNAVSFLSSGDIQARGVASSYMSFATTYYPATFSSWLPIPLSGTWTSYAAAYSPPECSKASDDLVIVRGLIKSGTTGTLGTLPASCGTTDGQLIFPSWMSPNSAARVDITTASSITGSPYSSTWTVLDNVRFIAD